MKKPSFLFRKNEKNYKYEKDYSHGNRSNESLRVR